MSIVSSGSLTITDVNDATQLILYLDTPNKTQIYDPNITGSTAFNPDFSTNNLVITPQLYVAGGGNANLLPSSNIVSCTWYEGTQTNTALSEGSGTLADGVSSYSIATGDVKTVSKKLTLKSNLGSAISKKFTCVVVYHDSKTNYDINMKADIEIIKITNGVKGQDGSGADAVVGVLSNENCTIPADSTGIATSPNLSIATSTLKIYEGTSDVTSNYSIVLTRNPTDTAKFNITTSGTVTNQTVTVSTMDASLDSASVTFTATRNGYPTITKTFNVSKVKMGADAKIYYLQIPSVLGVSNSGIYAQSSLTFLAYQKTGTANATAYNGYIQIDYTVDGNTWTNAVANTTQFVGGSYTYPASGSLPANIKFIRVRLYSASGGSGLLDEETVTIVKDGNDSFVLNVWCPQGDTIRNSSGTLTIKSDLYKGGLIVTPPANSWKWYVQEPNVTSTSSIGYESDGGTGWRFLQSIADPTVQPTLDSVTGGTLTGGTYWVKYTWVSTNGETKAPATGWSKVVTANYNLKITPPAFPTGVTSCKIYVGTASGSEKYQGTISTSGATYTISAPISTTGALPPSINTATYSQTTSGYITDTLTVPSTAITSIEGFKCVVTYNSNKYIGVTMVKDVTDPILCRIDGVDVFKNGDGKNTYRATLLQNGAELDGSSPYTYTYTWSIYNQDGTKRSFTATGKTCEVLATDISGLGNLVCEVSKA